MILKEKLQEYLEGLRSAVSRELRYGKGAAERQGLVDTEEILRCFRICFDKAKVVDIGRKLTYFLATGNLVSETGLDLQQTAGFVITGERLTNPNPDPDPNPNPNPNPDPSPNPDPNNK